MHSGYRRTEHPSRLALAVSGFQRYAAATKQVVWATPHLANTPEAMYFAECPKLVLGVIRFQHTRQWFPIDTIQHVAGFYLRLLPYWERLPSH